MSVLPILTYPDERLHTIAVPVQHFNETIKKLTEDMLETMYDANGIGLAATQVDVHKQVIVIDLQENDEKKPLVLINPKILESSETHVIGQEGCLSVPTIYDDVERAETVTVQACDVNGESYVLEANGLLAVCIQHEMDHLNGQVFVQYLSQLKRDRIKKKLKKLTRHSA